MKEWAEALKRHSREAAAAAQVAIAASRLRNRGGKGRIPRTIRGNSVTIDHNGWNG